MKKLRNVFSGGMALLTMVFALAVTVIFPVKEVKAEEAGNMMTVNVYYVYVNTQERAVFKAEEVQVPDGTTLRELHDEIAETTLKSLDAKPPVEWYFEPGTMIDENGETYISDMAMRDTGGWIRFEARYDDYDSGYYHLSVLDENGEEIWGNYNQLIEIPTSYAFGSEEAKAWVLENLARDEDKNYYAAYGGICEVNERGNGYQVTIKISEDNAASNGESSTGGSQGTADSESTYTSEDGVAMRKITVEGNNEISIVGNQEYLPAGASFTCANVESGDQYNLAADAIRQKLSNNTNFKVLEMNLRNAENGEIHELNGYVNVTLPIPAGLSVNNEKTLVVYRLEADGTLTKCDTNVENGYITFATNHFSTYIIAEQSLVKEQISSPKTGDTYVPVVCFMSMLLSIGMLVLKLVKRKTV